MVTSLVKKVAINAKLFIMGLVFLKMNNLLFVLTDNPRSSWKTEVFRQAKLKSTSVMMFGPSQKGHCVITIKKKTHSVSILLLKYL